MNTTRHAISPKVQIALSLACLYAVFLILNLKTIQWPFVSIDSPTILAHAIAYSPVEYFLSPGKYQFLSINNLTPWVTFSWDVDYSLFQLEPLGYRVHQLLSAAALLGAVYLLLLRLTGSVLNSSVFSLAITTLPSTWAVTSDPVNRHYLEGLLCAILCLLLATLYNRSQRKLWLVLSTLLYGVSLSAKEIFIPLPGILFFVFQGNLRRRLLLICPYAVVLIVYMTWRLYMIGGAGGYSSPDEYFKLIESQPILIDLALRIISSLFVNPAASFIVLSLLALLIVINFRELGWYGISGLLIGVVAVGLPILALLPQMDTGLRLELDISRWLYAPAMAIPIFLAYLCSRTQNKALVRLVYVVVVAISASSIYLRVSEPVSDYMKISEGVYKNILKSDPDRYLLTPAKGIFENMSRAAWVYVAKLHNDRWGTLPISEIGQLRYHDTRKKVPKRVGGWFTPEDIEAPFSDNLDLVKSVEYDPHRRLITFHFAESMQGAGCFIYFFGDNNGMLLRQSDCGKWRISYPYLRWLVGMTGYNLADTSIAIWTRSPLDRKYSRPYRMSELIELDTYDR